MAGDRLDQVQQALDEAEVLARSVDVKQGRPEGYALAKFQELATIMDAVKAGLITKAEAEEQGFGSCQQAYVTWDFSNPNTHLDFNSLLKSLKRHIETRIGAANLKSAGYVLDCGGNFHAAIQAWAEKALFPSWAERPADPDKPVPFILADNVRVVDGISFGQEDNAFLLPLCEDVTRRVEFSVKIVGLDLPVEPPKPDPDADKEAIAVLQGLLIQRGNELALSKALHQDALDQVAALRAEIAALKGTPAKPSDAAVLGRALGAHR